jgi:hypothetical protein
MTISAGLRKAAVALMGDEKVHGHIPELLQRMRRISFELKSPRCSWLVYPRDLHWQPVASVVTKFQRRANLLFMIFPA